MSLSLVVLAAGMGSRYGGIKQIESLGPSNESLIDYSIYNSIKAGVTKIIMIIRKEIESDIKAFFKDRIPSNIDVHWVFQELDKIPAGFSVPKNRTKPWGTAHALLMCKEVLNEPFIMINGDDYYAYEAIKPVADFLSSVDKNSNSSVLAGYDLNQTLSPNGLVSRGICQVDDNNNLLFLEEHKKIGFEQDKILSTKDDGTQEELTGNEFASMNLFGFTQAFIGLLEAGFVEFLKAQGQEEKSEFFVPEYLGRLLKAGKMTSKVAPTSAQWFGVTYKEDKPIVVDTLKKLVDGGAYPTPLW